MDRCGPKKVILYSRPMSILEKGDIFKIGFNIAHGLKFPVQVLNVFKYFYMHL